MAYSKTSVPFVKGDVGHVPPDGLGGPEADRVEPTAPLDARAAYEDGMHSAAGLVVAPALAIVIVIICAVILSV